MGPRTIELDVWYQHGVELHGRWSGSGCEDRGGGVSWWALSPPPPPAAGRGRGRALPRAPARELGVMLPESGGEHRGPPFPRSVTVSGQGGGLGVQSHSTSCLEKREGHCRQALVSRGDSARRVMGSALPCRLFSPRSSCPGAQPPGPGSGGGAVRGQSPALTNEC